MSLTPGTRLGAYRVLAALGAGGMGEVYCAHDPRLERDVALKILPIEVARDPTRLERFSREARIIAALNHPNIVTVHSTEEADGVRFFTMELVRGRTLDALIKLGGIALAEFFEIALPLADALTAAHQKGITHRDLKPGNVVMSTDGRVKVLDFGLAKPSAPPGGPGDLDITAPPMTTPGMVVGTLPYMSPEQVEGTAVDHRSDLFSLGIMFYELLTGCRPFTGDSSPALMSSILRDSVPGVSELRADVPMALSDLVSRCLQKRPDDRVQTAREVYQELRRLQRAVDPGARRQDQPTRAADRAPVDSLRIGVEPFTWQGTADAESVASGLTEDIRSGLSRFAYLSVLAGSARADDGRPRDSREARARYAVEGSIRGSADRLRINARLVDTEHATQLWSDTYERGLAGSNALAVQDDVADRIVATVADTYGVLMQSMTAAVGYGPLSGMSSSEVGLRYWRYHRQHTALEHEQLRDAMEALAEREPTRATAWAALAHLYCHETMFGFNPRPESLRRARQAATRAMDLDVGNQHAWEALAVSCFFDHDRAGFLDAAERAIALNPRNTNTAAWIGTLLAHMGEHDRGIEIVDRAIALNPYHPRWYYFAHFVAHYDRGNFTEALHAARKVNLPDHLWSQFALALSCAELGLADEGQRALDAFFRIAPELAAGGEASVRDLTARWKWSNDIVERIMDGFRKAIALSR